MECPIWKYHGCLGRLLVEEIGRGWHCVGIIENHFTIADTLDKVIDGHVVAKYIRYDIKGIYIPPMMVNDALDEFDFLGPMDVADPSYIQILERPCGQIAALL